MGNYNKPIPPSRSARMQDVLDFRFLNKMGDTAYNVQRSVTTCLRDGVVVGPLDEDGAGAGVADILDERELVVPEGLLVNLVGD